MNKHLLSGIAATTFVASLAFAAPASAAVTFDAATGTGFVGKGDVQLALGLNDKSLQEQAALGQFRFSTVSTVVSDASWECIKYTIKGEEITQERQLTTTTSTSGVVSMVARDNKTNKVNGFNLTGYSSTTQPVTTVEGPERGSCPNSASGYVPSADGVTETVSKSGMLSVSSDTRQDVVLYTYNF